MTSIELILCALLVITSASMSSAEVALFSLSRFQLRALKEHLKPGIHRRITRLTSDPGGLLVSILVVTEVMSVALSSIIARAVSRGHFEAVFTRFPGIPAWAFETLLGTLITAPIVLFLCEITPKVIGARANQLVASLAAQPLTLLYELARPLRAVLTFLIRRLSRALGGNGESLPHEAEGGILKESDFMMMLEEGHREGAIHESEIGLIKNVFELDDTTALDILTPLAQVQTVPPHATLKNALATFRQHRHSRIPVLAQGRKIVGILFSKDLLRAKLEAQLMTTQVSAVMRRPLVVSPMLRLNSLFRKFKQERTHLAVVQNEAGEALGIVTMNDVLEALFSELVLEPAKEAGKPRPAAAAERGKGGR